MGRIREFELLVLLSILRQRETPYANQIRRDLAENAGRSVTRGALYSTLDALAGKGLIEWEIGPSEIPARGGHPMRQLRITESGLEGVRTSREVLTRFFDVLDALEST